MGVQHDSKCRAAEEAVSRVRSGMVLGLGTGSTAALAVEAIGRKLAEGELVDLVGIPTSNRTRDQAHALGVPLTTLEEHPKVDLTIDGADEVDAQGNLIKGGGGALLWEKIVAAATALYIIVVDESKLVERLGAGVAVPIEVMPFGWRTHLESMRALEGDPTLRRDDAGQPYLTDGGHYIIDVAFSGGMDDPYAVDRVLRDRPGVVETGLFLGMEPCVIVGRAQ
jgi:ribose 5-phosphate isomerase A